MLTDPVALTYNTIAKNLARTGNGPDMAEYRLMDGTTAIYHLRIGHTFKQRHRAYARLQRDAYAADPIIPAQNILTGAVCTFSVDFNPVGTTVADARNLALALSGYLSSGNLDKILSGEV